MSSDKKITAAVIFITILPVVATYFIPPVFNWLILPSRSLPIPNLVLCLSLSLNAGIVGFLLHKYLKTDPIQQYPFLIYREDQIESIVCRWNYSLLGSAPVVIHLQWFCPDCDTELKVKSRTVTANGNAMKRRRDRHASLEKTGQYMRLICEHCNNKVCYPEYHGSFDDLQQKFLDQIYRKIRSGEWKKIMENSSGSNSDSP